MALAPDQLTSYQRDGYLVPQTPLFPPGDFERLQAIFEEDLAQYGEDKLDGIHFHDARLLEFLLSDVVLDIVEPLVGSDIGLWSSHFICKPPKIGKATPWHEDSAYWDGRVSTMEGICTVWLALDEVTSENGCMKVIPGTHRSQASREYQPVDGDAHVFESEIKPEQVDASEAVELLLSPNEYSVHDARIVHGAEANTSDRRRAGYTMRYFPTTTQVYPAQNVGHRIWLARGRDRAGNRYETSG